MTKPRVQSRKGFSTLNCYQWISLSLSLSLRYRWNDGWMVCWCRRRSPEGSGRQSPLRISFFFSHVLSTSSSIMFFYLPPSRQLIPLFCRRQRHTVRSRVRSLATVLVVVKPCWVWIVILLFVVLLVLLQLALICIISFLYLIEPETQIKKWRISKLHSVCVSVRAKTKYNSNKNRGNGEDKSYRK